jgi:tetratricopeptide (TPR) repeat protein
MMRRTAPFRDPILMVCPRCGQSLSALAGLCPACGAGVAVGVLTPPPSDQTGATTLFPDEAPTGVSVMDPVTELPPVDALRGFASKEAPTIVPGAAQKRPAVGIPAVQGGPLAVGENFGNRYHISRLLGTGGMGAVYEAWDAELGVKVAIKVIRPEITADPTAAADMERRFKRELVLARQVTHKNVVRIHDLGEIDGIKYITMPYVEGADLATVLAEQGRLPIAKTLRIIRSVVSGLAAAHAADVVHRDLKPANIMIDANDDALIMDFGIALSTGMPIGSRLPGEMTLAGNLKLAMAKPQATISGAVVGTLAYMAPEQARGLPVDQRADIYAIGLILYDMLAGRSRSALAKPLDELKARMDQAPPAIRSMVPDVPEPLAALVSRCLEPDPAKRYQKTVDLAAELDRLDEGGNLIRVKRVVGLPLVAAVVSVLLALSVATWWYGRSLPPPAQHEPVSVLIGDFQNASNDPAFDHTLEPVLKLALEGAGFISAYDRNGISRTMGVHPPEKLDERAASELAARQGVGVVLSGSIERRGNGYLVSVKATQAVTGKVITTAKSRASSKEQVLNAATNLANTVREALGDDTSDSKQLFAMDTVSATSLEVVRNYAAAMEALSNSRFEDARAGFAKAVELDPNFGLGYAGMAAAARNLDRMQDAQKYIKEAVRHLDGMTERERYRTRGLAFEWTSDYQACVKEFSDLIERYSADAMARNNLAVCLTYLRELPKATEEMRQAIKILPNRTLFHENLALYAAYSTDFQAAEQEARAIENPSLFGLLPLAFAQLLKGELPQAAETYGTLTKFGQQGTSYTASGLGDLAIYQGRYSDAVRIFTDGAANDVASKDSDRAASKFLGLAYAQLLRKQNAAAIAAAEKALTFSEVVKVRFLAARVYVEAGAAAKARALAAALVTELQAEPQAYAQIVEGEAALKSGDARQAVKAFTEANKVFDTWIGHFDLGRAYLAANAFTQADSEFDRCIKRRGETLALFLDEEPTAGYLPPLYYYKGQVREGLKSAGFADSYRTYLVIRGQSKEDPLAAELRTKKF